MTKEIAWSYAPIYRAGRAVGHLPVARARELSPSHRARLYRAVKRAEAVPLRPGVFAPTAAWQNLNAEDRHRARVAEAVAALSFPLVVSHESAAVIHGIPLLGGVTDTVHVTHHADPDAESPGESLCRARFLLLHAPMPTLQAPVFINGRHYRVDFLWEELGIVGEFDGALKYGGTAQDSSEAVYQEKLREDDLRTHFKTVIRIIWNDALRVDALERELRRVGVLTGLPVRDQRFV